MHGREKFAKFRPAITILTKLYGLLPRRVRQWLFVRIRNKPGMLGLAMRYALLKTLAKSVGENVSIQPGVFLLSPQELTVGSNVSIHPMCYLECCGGVTIESNVSIAHAVSVISFSHSFEDTDVPIKYQPLIAQPIHIADNVWIGARATILGGVSIGSGAVVGAGAVVKWNVEEKTIVAGVPAREIKRR